MDANDFSLAWLLLISLENFREKSHVKDGLDLSTRSGGDVGERPADLFANRGRVRFNQFMTLGQKATVEDNLSLPIVPSDDVA